MKCSLAMFVVAGLTLSLSGCYDDYELAEAVVTPIESQMFRTYHKNFFNSPNSAISYHSTVNAIINDRVKKVDDVKTGARSLNLKNPPDLSAYPFCKYYEQIRVDERSLQIQYPIRFEKAKSSGRLVTTQFESIYKMPMEAACSFKKSGVPTTISHNPIVEKPIEVVTVIAEETISKKEIKTLPPETYDYLIKTVGDCGRARTKLLDLTDNKEYLTQEDGDKVVAEIMKCKRTELENELNK